MTITCPTCGATADKPAGHVNRARRLGLAVYCGRECAGMARRIFKSKAVRVAEKAAYDAEYRARTVEARRARQAAYYQNVTKKNPERERAIRKARMPKHVEYCRRPEYRTEGWRDCQCRYDRPHGNAARVKRRRARRNLKQKLNRED